MIILGAEMYAVYSLFPAQGTIGGQTRTDRINTILGWANEKLDEDSDIATAMWCGIGGTGQGYLTAVDAQLRFLIDFTRRFKLEPAEDQAKLLDDPWALKAWTDDIEESGREMRHVVLHLLYPDSFERIASGSDKRQIAKAFTKLITDLPKPPSDTDEQLFAIRKRLTDLGVADGLLDFYWAPLDTIWDPSPTSRADATTNLEALEHKSQLVLFGPPGTSKTYNAKRLAREVIARAALDRWGVEDFFKEEQLEGVMEHQVERLQLHPAYSYEDFIQGLRLHDGELQWEDGYLMVLADRIREAEKSAGQRALPWVLILDEINRTDLSRLFGEAFSLLEDRDEPVKLMRGKKTVEFSLPSDLYIIGTMNLIDQSVEQLDFAIRRRFLWSRCDFNRQVVVEEIGRRWKKLLENGEAWLQRHSWEDIEPEVGELADQAVLLNEEIQSLDLLGREYAIGHTYYFDLVDFLQRWPRLASKNRPASYLWTARGYPTEPLKDLWSFSLEPLLEQYLAGMDDAQSRRQELDELSNVLYYGERNPD